MGEHSELWKRFPFSANASHVLHVMVEGEHAEAGRGVPLGHLLPKTCKSPKPRHQTQLLGSVQHCNT